MFNLAAFDYHSIHFHLLYRGFRFSLPNIFFTLLFVLLVAFSLRMRILVKMGKLPFSHLAAFDFHLLMCTPLLYTHYMLGLIGYKSQSNYPF